MIIEINGIDERFAQAARERCTRNNVDGPCKQGRRELRALSAVLWSRCLAQLRAPSRVRLVGGARCGARVFWLTQTRISGRLGSPPAPVARWALPRWLDG